MIHNGLDESRKALDYLEKSFAEHEVQLSFIKIDTRRDDLRAALCRIEAADEFRINRAFL
jgi:hypothetical protein